MIQTRVNTVQINVTYATTSSVFSDATAATIRIMGVFVRISQ